MTPVLLALLLTLAGVGELRCRSMQITGYVRTDHGPLTFDETPIWTPERIAAASWDIPLGWYVIVQDAGLYRVADRGGGLGSSGWVDIAVWSRAEALALTSRRTVCVISPSELGATQP